MNSTDITESDIRSQTSCPEVFAKYFAPRKNLPGAEGNAAKSLPTPTGGEARSER